MNPEQDNPRNSEPYRQRLYNEAGPFIEQYTVPLIWFPDGNQANPRIRGTGVAFAIGSNHFIVTAGHVADMPDSIFIAIKESDGTLFKQIRGDRIGTKSENGKHTDEPIDVAFFHLSEESANDLCQKKFLNLAQTDPADSFDSSSYYVVFGYPDAWFKKEADKLHLTSIVNLTYVRADGEKLFDIFNSNSNFAFELDAKNGVDSDNIPLDLGSLGGISGCGIWRVAKKGIGCNRWSKSDVKLVAIQHTHSPQEKLVLSTRFNSFLSLVWREFPDLQKLISMHVGTSWKQLQGIKLVKKSI